MPTPVFLFPRPASNSGQGAEILQKEKLPSMSRRKAALCVFSMGNKTPIQQKLICPVERNTFSTFSASLGKKRTHITANSPLSPPF